MDLASVVAALASVGVRVSGSTPNNNIQGDSSRACPTGLAGPEPSGTHNDPGQHFHNGDMLLPLIRPSKETERQRKHQIHLWQRIHHMFTLTMQSWAPPNLTHTMRTQMNHARMTNAMSTLRMNA